jgi:hypothetical protein
MGAGTSWCSKCRIKEENNARCTGGRHDNRFHDRNRVRARSTPRLQRFRSRSCAGHPREPAQPRSAARSNRSNPHNDWGRTSIQPAGRYAGWNAIAPARSAARGDRSTKAEALKLSDLMARSNPHAFRREGCGDRLLKEIERKRSNCCNHDSSDAGDDEATHSGSPSHDPWRLK